ncbi:hypothetical protein [Stieleria mannarensis]|uniref:hypothetical protein n=1 Tax=Stieleria mannarensis TaxID=2755585 RepID=UPI001603871F|nr:hypothetical protein [Rhodopirellula sp. JC639]
MNESQRQRFSDALVRVAGDEEILEMLAKIAAEDAPGLMSQLDDYVKQSELAEAARVGHALKGLLSTFETGEPTCELQPLIDAARAGDQSTVTSVHSAIQPDLNQLVSEIDALVG